MSNNIFMLCHYGDNNIVTEVNSSITYNSGSSLLLTSNLGMSIIYRNEKNYLSCILVDL
jgi:hypothetical protein